MKESFLKNARKGYATLYFTYTSSIIVKKIKIQEEQIICEIHDQSKDVQINAFNQNKMDNIRHHSLSKP